MAAHQPCAALRQLPARRPRCGRRSSLCARSNCQYAAVWRPCRPTASCPTTAGAASFRSAAAPPAPTPAAAGSCLQGEVGVLVIGAIPCHLEEVYRLRSVRLQDAAATGSELGAWGSLSGRSGAPLGEGASTGCLTSGPCARQQCSRKTQCLCRHYEPRRMAGAVGFAAAQSSCSSEIARS